MVKYLRLSWKNDADIPVLLVSFKPIGIKLLNSENLEGTVYKTYDLRGKTRDFSRGMKACSCICDSCKNV